jgi:hypothetical protein
VRFEWNPEPLSFFGAVSEWSTALIGDSSG